MNARRFLLSVLALLAASPAIPADILTPAGPSGAAAWSYCFENGNSGPRVPCTLDADKLWKRVLRPGDPGGSLTASPSDGRGRGSLDDLIGRTALRFYPENYGNGAPVCAGGDDTAPIKAAVEAARAARGTAVVRRVCRISQKITVPNSATLALEGGELFVTANIPTAIGIEQYGRLDGWGDVFVGVNSSFTGAAVEMNGNNPITDAQVSGSIRVHNVSGVKSGVGFRMIAEGSFAARVIYARAEFAMIENFAIGVHLKATGSAFVNSNYIKTGAISDCIEGIVTEIDDVRYSAAGFNFFEGSIQPGEQSMRAVRLGSQGNQVNMMIWDWHISADPKTAIEFSPDSRNNIVRSPIGIDFVMDRSSAAKNDANLVEDWYNAAPSLRPVMPPSLRFPSWAGNQDDIFANADKRPGWTVTQTAGSPPVSGALSSLFDLNPDNVVFWNSSSSYPIQIEIDFGNNPPGYLLGMGVSFDYGAVSSRVEFATFDGTSFTVRRKFDNNSHAQPTWLADGFLAGVKKVAFTFYAPPPGGAVYLSRIFGYGTIPDGGGAFRPAFTNAPLAIKDGVPEPAPIPGYVLFYRDVADFKFKLKEGNGTVRVLNTTP